MSDDKSMEEFYHAAMDLVADKLGQGAYPLEIAAVLMGLSMSMYRTVMDENDYNQMIDSISESRDKVRPFYSTTNLH